MHHASAAGGGAGVESFCGGEEGEAKPDTDGVDEAGRRDTGKGAGADVGRADGGGAGLGKEFAS